MRAAALPGGPQAAAPPAELPLPAAESAASRPLRPFYPVPNRHYTLICFLRRVPGAGGALWDVLRPERKSAA